VLAATVFETTTGRAIETARIAALRADLVEVRLDPLTDPEPEAIVAAVGRKLILTCRPENEGGRYVGSEEDRLDLLRRGIAAGAAWIDIELSAALRLGSPGASRLIVSHHDFEGTPDDLDGLVERLLEHRPDVAKLAVTASGPEDVLAVLALLRRHHGPAPLAAHTMGAAGVAGRILAARFGSAIVYGAARPDAAAAPGQPALRALLSDYGLDRDLEDADVLLLLGGDLGHSVSPRMMNRTFRKNGIDALYVPFALDDPQPVLAAAADLACRGIAVTFPLKETVAGLVDATDDLAERVGAVNTVELGAEGLVGHNTDVDGALGAIREELSDLEGRHAVVVGAGGAARAAVFGLREAGARVTVVNRDPDRAARLASESGASAAALSKIDPETVDLVVNATPVGQWPDTDRTPVPAGFLREGMTVLDMVYNPEATRLLREADAAGARIVPGIEMLAGQAGRQLELWLGAGGLREDLRREGRAALLEDRRSILLIGMRGAGKSTVGRLVARGLGRAFVDLDDVIEEDAGISIAEIFAREGEEEFRRIEREAFRRELSVRPYVLAAGGGTFEDAGSVRQVLEHRPFVIYLYAPVPVLADRVRDSGRPSLTGRPPEEEIPEVLARREPVYRRLAHLTIDTSEEDLVHVIDRILHQAR
jgi:3-dehydroquinate dehydratase/shikimate dehydrogenase